jgi:hypothetical protein
MAVLADKKTVGAPFDGQSKLVKVEYNFAVDTGAQADYDVLEADGSMVVELVFAKVNTAVTSGGSLVMDLGKAAGGVEFFSDKAVAALTLDSMHQAVALTKAVELTDGEKIVMGIEAADATAGKIEFVFRIYKRPE